MGAGRGGEVGMHRGDGSPTVNVVTSVPVALTIPVRDMPRPVRPKIALAGSRAMSGSTEAQ
ncbi:hypothetical protein ADK67_37820 [Saccharothrix sp. NRRL B-16348]|nr:hypothetical protein ADK67_37820 [Saccharothrix sp. NRRL B-16348]